jgi:hypothetical protein
VVVHLLRFWVKQQSVCWANFWYVRSPSSFLILPLWFSLHFLMFPPVF